MSEILLILHVVTAVFVVGPLVIFPMLGLRAMRSGDAGQAKAMARMTRVFTIVSLVVLVLGFGLVAVGEPKYNLSVLTPWVAASIIIYLVSATLLLFVTAQSMSLAAARMASGGATGIKDGGYRIVAASSGLAALGLVTIVVLMVWKP